MADRYAEEKAIARDYIVDTALIKNDGLRAHHRGGPHHRMAVALLQMDRDLAECSDYARRTSEEEAARRLA